MFSRIHSYLKHFVANDVDQGISNNVASYILHMVSLAALIWVVTRQLSPRALRHDQSNVMEEIICVSLSSIFSFSCARSLLIA